MTQKKNQNKFMFYENFLNAIEQLPKEEQANACLEFCRYGINGILPNNKYIAMFCLGVSASVQKYQGRGGVREGAGRPKKQENQNNQKNQNNQNNQNEQTKTKNINLNINLNNKDIYKESFEIFWKEYPKQRAGNKQKAYKAYCKVLTEKRADTDKLLNSVKNYALSEEVSKGYAKGCEAWLNDDRFNNEYKLKKEWEPF